MAALGLYLAYVGDTAIYSSSSSAEVYTRLAEQLSQVAGPDNGYYGSLVEELEDNGQVTVYNEDGEGTNYRVGYEPATS